LSDTCTILDSSAISKPSVTHLDVTAGRRLMQRELKMLRAFTDCSDRTQDKPDVLIDYHALPFRDGQFDVVLFDPPHTCDKPGRFMSSDELVRTPLAGRLTRGQVGAQIRHRYGFYRSIGQMRKSLYLVWREIERVLKVGGVCVFKWGTKVKGESWALALRPDTLKLQRLKARRSRGGKLYRTIFAWLTRVKSGPAPMEVYNTNLYSSDLRDYLRGESMPKGKKGKKAKGGNGGHRPLIYVPATREMFQALDKVRGDRSRGAQAAKLLAVALGVKDVWT